VLFELASDHMVGAMAMDSRRWRFLQVLQIDHEPVARFIAMRAPRVSKPPTVVMAELNLS
jgi:hypothetical protein